MKRQGKREISRPGTGCAHTSVNPLAAGVRSNTDPASIPPRQSVLREAPSETRILPETSMPLPAVAGRPLPPSAGPDGVKRLPEWLLVSDIAHAHHLSHAAARKWIQQNGGKKIGRRWQIHPQTLASAYRADRIAYSISDRSELAHVRLAATV